MHTDMTFIACGFLSFLFFLGRAGLYQSQAVDLSHHKTRVLSAEVAEAWCVAMSWQGQWRLTYSSLHSHVCAKTVQINKA